jgi:hypothetical protein
VNDEMDRFDGTDIDDQRVSSEAGDEPRPDFARGQDQGANEDVHEVGEGPDFARGQREGDADVDGSIREHRGTFAEGQQDHPHHPEDALPGRFSRGQSDDVETPEDGVLGDRRSS